ncbi:MAG: hypothetical protein CVV39_08795 [Planctomycetes bacterium HGW-Planctomycetes-1]|nr:MAG: hypothetical protein CVV39_08795 [Planctomycetes bacterium HGW-Planctomycetes-1]
MIRAACKFLVNSDEEQGREVEQNIRKFSNSRINIFNILLVLLFVSLVSITIIIRIRTLSVPLERDEGEYAYAGQLMLQGVPPYSLAYNMKMPGIYAAYAVILAIFGQTASGIHLGVLFINAATIVLLFLLTKKFFGPIAGAAAAVFFALMSISNAIKATANAENFVVLLAIAGILLLVNFTESKKTLSLAAGGLLLGIAFMMKQHGAAFIIFGFLFLVWREIKHRPLNWKRLIFVSLVYGFCAILPFLITCLILWRCSVFGKFWFWTFEYSRHYISIISPLTGFKVLKIVLGDIFSASIFLCLSALLGFLSIIWNREIRRQWVFLVFFFICSFLAVCPGFYFRRHYFLLFLPALCILGSVGVIAIRDLLGKVIKSQRRTQFIAILIVLAIWLQSFYSQRDYLLESDPVKISRIGFGLNPFPEILKIAEYIKANSNKEDKIAVFGSEPQIFFYSQRRSATPYIYVYPLMEPQPYALKMQHEIINLIEADNPRFAVIVKVFPSWLVWEDTDRTILKWIDSYILPRYRQIGLVEMLSMKETSYRWDSAAKPSREDGWIFIGERGD